jgi:hypothetical protein
LPWREPEVGEMLEERGLAAVQGREAHDKPLF